MGKTNMTGTVVGVDVTATQKIWRSFQAVGDIAFAYAYATVLIEIQVSLFIFCEMFGDNLVRALMNVSNESHLLKGNS